MAHAEQRSVRARHMKVKSLVESDKVLETICKEEDRFSKSIREITIFSLVYYHLLFVVTLAFYIY